MKKLFFVILLSLICCIPVFALKVKVEAMSDFSSDNPPKVYSVKVVEPIVGEKTTIEKGSIIKGNITVKQPKRLKRDATFSFIPTSLTTPDGKVHKAKKECRGKYKKEINKKKVAKSTAIGAGNLVVKGIAMEYYAAEGFIKNEQNNRLKSTAVSLYKNSPFSYIEKGNPLEIKKGEQFYINFKTKD